MGKQSISEGGATDLSKAFHSKKYMKSVVYEKLLGVLKIPMRLQLVRASTAFRKIRPRNSVKPKSCR